MSRLKKRYFPTPIYGKQVNWVEIFALPKNHLITPKEKLLENWQQNNQIPLISNALLAKINTVVVRRSTHYTPIAQLVRAPHS